MAGTAEQLQEPSGSVSRVADEGLRASLQSLVVDEVAESIIGTLDAPTLCAVTVQKTMDLLGAESASLLFLDEGPQRAVSGRRGDERARLPRGACVAGWVALHKKPALVADARADQLPEAGPQQHPPLSAERSSAVNPGTRQLVAHVSFSYREPRRGPRRRCCEAGMAGGAGRSDGTQGPRRPIAKPP